MYGSGWFGVVYGGGEDATQTAGWCQGGMLMEQGL